VTIPPKIVVSFLHGSSASFAVPEHFSLQSSWNTVWMDKTPDAILRGRWKTNIIPYKKSRRLRLVAVATNLASV
jgi:hypothetical protein